jgi:hypothetical protein
MAKIGDQIKYCFTVSKHFWHSLVRKNFVSLLKSLYKGFNCLVMFGINS